MAGHDHGRERLLGIALVVLSAATFALVDGFSKLLTDGASVAQIVWARYALALPVLLAMTPPSKLPTLFRTARPGLLVLRGLTPIGVSIAMVLAVRHMPLAEATVILFAAPFLVVALSVPVLGERVGVSRWVAVAIGFVAVLVVARPGFDELSHYAVFPMIAAVFYAVMQLVTRRAAASGERPLTILAWTLLTGTVVASPALVFFWQPLDLRSWLLMLCLGTSFGIAQRMMIAGFARAPAALLAPLSYVQIVSAVVFGLVVFRDVPDLWSLLGIVMIVGSGIYVVRQRQQ
jgi:drug/metabolite transporter (DMT)-like permease